MIAFLLAELIIAGKIALPITALLWVRHFLKSEGAKKKPENGPSERVTRPIYSPGPQQDTLFRNQSIYSGSRFNRPSTPTHNYARERKIVRAAEFNSTPVLFRDHWVSDGEEIWDHDTQLWEQHIIPCPILERRSCLDCRFYLHAPKYEWGTKCGVRNWIDEVAKQGKAEAIGLESALEQM